MHGSLCLYYYVLMEVEQQLRHIKVLTNRHSYLKIPHIFKIWIFQGWWSDQKFCCLWLKSYILKILVGPIIAWLRFFSNGRASLAVLPLLPYFHNLESAKHFTKLKSFFAKLKFRSLQNLDCATWQSFYKNILQIPDLQNQRFVE